MTFLIKDKNFYHQISSLGIPVILQGLITAGVGMMDTLMVGKLGELDLSAVSLANQFITIFMIMCFGLGFGASVLTAQFYGSKNIQALKKIITIMLRLALLIAFIFFFVNLIFPEAIMRLYTPNKAIISKGAEYFNFRVYSYIFMALSLTLTAVLRTVGQVKLPLYTSIAGFFINVILNYLLIFGNLGLPKLGIAGAALATVVTRVFEALVIGYFVLVKEKQIKYRVSDIFSKASDYYLLYIKVCLPVLISDTLLALGLNMVSVIMGHIGASFVAANAIISQVSRMTTIFNQGISSASSVITGNTLGSGDIEKTYEQGVSFVVLGGIIGLISGLLLLLVTPSFITIFNLKEETSLIAKQLMYATAIMSVFQALDATLTKGVLRGGGDTKFLMIADILFLWIVSVPLGYLTGLIWTMPAFLIYIALRSDSILKTIWCIKRLLTKKWMIQVEVEETQAA